MADLRTAAAVGSLHALAHLDAVVAVKGIALDYLRPDAFAAEDMRELFMTVVVPAPRIRSPAISDG